MSQKNNQRTENAYWILTLFGTAVGAGILFLPIEAGIGGFWVFITACSLVWFMVYPPQNIFARIVNNTSVPMDFTGAVKQFLGKKAGILINILFVLFLYALLIAYSIGLNNDIGEVLTESGLTKTNPAHGSFLSLLILLILFLIIKTSKKALIKVLGFLSILLIIFLLIISVALMDVWDFEGIFAIPPLHTFLKQFFLLFPILVMSFMFFSVISPMVISFREQNSARSDIESRYQKIIKKGISILMVFILFFVVSCLFSIDHKAALHASHENMSILTLLGESKGKPFLSKFGPFVSITALTTSFFGVALGYKESSMELISVFFHNKDTKKTGTVSEIIFFSFSIITLWIITILNFNIIDLFGELIAPLTALFLYFVPVIIIQKTHHFSQYRGIGNILIFLSGIILILSYFIGKMI